MNTSVSYFDDKLEKMRLKDDRALQLENRDSATRINSMSIPNPKDPFDPKKDPATISGWDAFDYWGETLAEEMTNRINSNRHLPDYKALICDAREFAKKENRTTGAWEPIVKYYQPALVYVKYNRTTYGGRTDYNYFFNLYVKNLVSGVEDRVAHLSFHSNIYPGAGSHIGNFHLKDESARPLVKGSEPFRRIFIASILSKSGAVRRFEFLLQKQSKEPVSKMAITFSKVGLKVLQEFFDAGFTAAKMNTPFDNCTGVKSPPEYITQPPPLPKGYPRVGGGNRKTRKTRKINA